MAGHRVKKDGPPRGEAKLQRRLEVAWERIEAEKVPLRRVSRAHDAFRAVAAVAPSQIREQYAERAVRDLMAATTDLIQLMNGDPE